MDVIEKLEEVNVAELDSKQAKEWLQQLAYYYMSGTYRAPDETRRHGYSLSPGETADKIKAEFTALVEAAGYPAFSRLTANRMYENEAKRRFNDTRGIGAQLREQNLRRYERVMQKIDGILEKEDVKAEVLLNAIDRLVAVEKREAVVTGYEAPQKLAVITANADLGVSEEDKERIRRAKNYTEDFEQSLLQGGDVVEGETTP